MHTQPYGRPALPAHARAHRRRRARRLRRTALRLLLLAAGLALAVLLCLLLTGLAQPVAATPGATAAASASGAGAQQPPTQRFVVAIDPGHGGSDAGAVGDALNEADMTWNTAQALMALLEADDRFAPFLTKTQGETCKPSERAATANAQGAQLFLAIHGNSDPVYGAAGFECYPAPPGRTYHEESLRFARLLAEGFAQAGAKLRGVDGVRYLYYGEKNKKLIYESTDTTVRSDPSFTVLEDSDCPAVLAEQCFVTNAADVDAFGDEDGCAVSAGIYYRAICAWFGVDPLENT